MLRFLLVVVACLGIAAPHKIMPCYITRDAHYRQGDARFEPENYSIGICSHIIVGFAKINPDEEYSVYDHHDMQFYERVVGLRFQQAGLKIFLSIGGPDTESWMFSNVLQTKQSREHFAQHVMGLVRRFAFDGVDLAWFYPTVADKANYFYLLQSLKAKFDYNGLVSATVSANPTLIQNNYDVGAIANIVDFVNVMTHDYLGPHESKTGHKSPLFADPEDSSNSSVANSLELWAELGMPRNKIVMGVSPYGRTWLLNDAEVNGVGAPARPGAPFESNLEGVASLSDICHLSYYARPTWNDIQKVPYMVQKNVWVSYDNEESVKEKMKYVVENEYAGAYLYELSLDDFRSRCHGGLAAGFQPFDIANFMKKYLQTDFPVKPTSPPTPTPQPEYPGPCDHEVADGYNSPFRIDPKSCERYYYCGSDASYHRVIRHLSCGPGLWWSKTGEKCVYAHYGFCENIPPVMPPPPFWNGTYPFVDAVNNATKPKLEKLDGKLQ